MLLSSRPAYFQFYLFTLFFLPSFISLITFYYFVVVNCLKATGIYMYHTLNI